jgi:predicted  nucleic acid-binding Zn-ribbon protein
MPHQCVRCSELYPTGAQELLKGCKCGSRFFFFVRESSIEKAKEITANLSNREKDQIEKDVLGIVGSEMDGNPVILDFESIKVVKPGQYELDLIDLFKGKPLIYKLSEGKYVIDIVTTFENQKKRKRL